MREGKKCAFSRRVDLFAGESLRGKLDAWEGMGVAREEKLNNSPGNTFLEEVKNKRSTT